MQSEELLSHIIHGVAGRSYTLEVDDLEEPEVEYRGSLEDMVPLFDEEHQRIIMQRDVHFGGKFDLMLDYYRQKEAPGIDENITMEAILELQEQEQRLKKNIAPFLLSGYEMEKVAYFKSLYRQFQEVDKLAKPHSTEKLIASLFLSDGLWHELVEKTNVSKIDKPELLYEILDDTRFRNPLAPGFGTVPLAVARLLGRLGTKEAMYALFSVIGGSDFELEEEALVALRKMGPMVRDFCIQKVQSEVISLDHERALIVLQEFLPDDKVKECARTFLEKYQGKNVTLLEYVKNIVDIKDFL